MKRIEVVAREHESSSLLWLQLERDRTRGVEVCGGEVDLKPGDEATVYVVKKGEKVEGALGRLSKAARALRERYMAVLANTGADKYCHQAARDLDQLIIAAEVERVAGRDELDDEPLVVQVGPDKDKDDFYTMLFDGKPPRHGDNSNVSAVREVFLGTVVNGVFEVRVRRIGKAPKPERKSVVPVNAFSCPECKRSDIPTFWRECPGCGVLFSPEPDC